jgi:hypothetical protein
MGGHAQGNSHCYLCAAMLGPGQLGRQRPQMPPSPAKHAQAAITTRMVHSARQHCDHATCANLHVLLFLENIIR